MNMEQRLLPRTWKETGAILARAMLQAGIKNIPRFEDKRTPQTVDDFGAIFHSVLGNVHIRRTRAYALSEQLVAEFALPRHVREFFALLRNKEFCDVVELLEKNPELLLAEDESGRRVLSHAAEYGSLEFVDVCLALGSEIDHRDAQGCTALYWSCNRKIIEVTHRLLTAGAECQEINNYGETPLGKALYHNRWHIAQTIVNIGRPSSRIYLDQNPDSIDDCRQGWHWIRLVGWGEKGCSRSLKAARSGDFCSAFKRERLTPDQFEIYKKRMPMVGRPSWYFTNYRPDYERFACGF